MILLIRNTVEKWKIKIFLSPPWLKGGSVYICLIENFVTLNHGGICEPVTFWILLNAACSIMAAIGDRCCFLDIVPIVQHSRTGLWLCPYRFLTYGLGTQARGSTGRHLHKRADTVSRGVIIYLSPCENPAIALRLKNPGIWLRGYIPSSLTSASSWLVVWVINCRKAGAQIVFWPNLSASRTY